MDQGIRILLLDDHSLFREGLSRLLETEPDFRMVGNCATVSEALTVLDREQVDIVLLDYDLGEDQGSAFLDKAKAAGYSGKVLMVTAGMGDADTLRAMERGCSGVFLKHSPPSELVDAIHKVLGGDMWLDPRAVRSLVAGANGRSNEQLVSESLTAREKTVLKGVFEGLNNKEIAAQLRVSEASVKWVMQQLFNKTGVRTRSQLVRIALEKKEWLANE